MKSLVCIYLGMLQPRRVIAHNGTTTACMGAHAYLWQKPSTKYVTACGFTPFSDAVQMRARFIYRIDNSSVDICIHHASLIVSYK